MLKGCDCAREEQEEEGRKIPANEELQDLSDFFKHFSEFSRIKILTALHYNSELCVCDLVELVGMNQPAVSHQLRILKAGRIVKSRKQGKHVYYSLDDNHVEELIRDGLEHVRGNCGDSY